MTTQLRVDDRLIPPSLLSVLHDSLHHVPPLYYAELHEMYSSVSNWGELERVREREKGRVREVGEEVRAASSAAGRGCWWSKRRRMKKFVKASERVLMMDLSWGLLLDLRLAYLKHMKQTLGITGLKIDDLWSHLPHLHLSNDELDELSNLGIRLLSPSSPSPESTPPPPAYEPPLPPSAIHCVLLHDIYKGKTGAMSSEGMRRWRERVGEGEGREEEWRCGESGVEIVR